MHLAGLPLSTLLAIGGAVGALTAVLYILKLRRRPVAVVFSPIWQRVLRDRQSSQLFSQLKRWLSLLLQLVLVALLAFALGDPRTAVSAVEGRNVVVLVDASASMKATDVAPSRIDRARREVSSLVDGLGGADRMLIAKMDATLTPLSTMTGEVTELRESVGRLNATDTRADLGRGLAFALDSLRGLSKPEVIIVSDGVLGDVERASTGLPLGSVKVSFIPVGERGENVALTQFSVRRYPLDKSRYEVMLEVTNTTDKPQGVELSLLGDGEVVDLSRLSLAPKERLPRFYADLGGASRRLEASLRLAGGSADDLPADDRAFALMPERRRARILVVTRGNTYLEAALLLDEYLEVTTVDPADYPPKGAFDVTIFDGVAPPVAQSTRAALYLAPPKEGSPVEVHRPIEEFGFDTWDKKSPVVRWIAMENIQVAKGVTFKPQKEDRVVGASVHGPTLVAGRRDGRPFVALGFDPRDSDMVMRVAWPLFVLNTVESFSEESAEYVSSFRTGDVWRVPAPAAANSASLRLPGGEVLEVPVKEGRAVFFGDTAGFYELSVGGNPGFKTEIAANLSDLDESHVAPVRELKLTGKPAAAVEGFSRGVRSELWVYVVLAAFALSVLEWLSLSPETHGMSERRARWVWLAVSLVFGTVLAAVYWRYVQLAPPDVFRWVHEEKNYELVDPRMLGLLLVAPLLLFALGRSLADLPWQQRVLALFFRVAFLALLALGLSRLVRTAETDKLCTVFLVDVSDSVPRRGHRGCPAVHPAGDPAKAGRRRRQSHHVCA